MHFQDNRVQLAYGTKIVNLGLKRYTANIFEVIFTVFNYVPISTVILLYGLHFIAAPSTV